jgi:hypothetical protein
MIILFLGDVVGRPGREAVAANVPKLRQALAADLVVANGENASGGLGLTPKNARELLDSGVDVLTSGNHIWKHKELLPYIDDEPRLLRPANYPPGAPGRGAGVFTGADGARVAIVNAMGRTYMDDTDCPFRRVDEELAALPDDVVLRVVDFHAEATSEKKALAYHLDGRVSAVLGTHTHVQTNDAQILGNGTAYVTDLGMCGVEDSILGMDPGVIIERFVSGMPKRFTLVKGQGRLQGALLDLDPDSGRAVSIELW